MYNNIFDYLEYPSVYKQSKEKFWDDEHISKQMLKAHLDPNYEGASRKLNFIEKSTEWIDKKLPFNMYTNLLDIGCGPGIYAERFCKSGYKVTGIDYSKRSVEYAKSSAKTQDLDIEYIYQDYLKMNYNNKFDLATFIYCDYGALSTENRILILEKIYESLKVEGKLLLDVFSIGKYNKFQEIKTWEVFENGGFWSKEKHIIITGNYRYSNNVTLEQIVVITEREVKNYYLWNHYFTKETLIKEGQQIGFKRFEVFSDVSGKSYKEDNETIAIIMEK